MVVATINTQKDVLFCGGTTVAFYILRRWYLPHLPSSLPTPYSTSRTKDSMDQKLIKSSGLWCSGILGLKVYI